MTTDYKAGQREFADWLTLHGVVLVELVGHGCWADDDDRDTFGNANAPMNRYTFKVANPDAGVSEKRPVSFNFRTGVGWTEEPELVHCMAGYIGDALDAITNSDWREWAENFYTSNAIEEMPYRHIQRLKGTWTAIKKAHKQITRLLPGVELDGMELQELIRERAGL